MMHANYPSATSYASLPASPPIHAMAQGIPQGPWSNVHRLAPGAGIPSSPYPQMHGALGRSMPVFQGALGTVPGVGIVGALGQEGAASSTVVTGLLVAAGMAAAYGAGMAYFVGSRNPVRNTALYAGGVTAGTGLLALLVAKAA